jgi:hypothetical protein
VNDYFFNFVALPDLINNIQPFKYFSEAGMLPVEMFRIGTAVADKKLRSACVSSRVSHRKDTSVVVLIIAG